MRQRATFVDTLQALHSLALGTTRFLDPYCLLLFRPDDICHALETLSALAFAASNVRKICRRQPKLEKGLLFDTSLFKRQKLVGVLGGRLSSSLFHRAIVSFWGKGRLYTTSRRSWKQPSATLANIPLSSEGVIKASSYSVSDPDPQGQQKILF